MFLLILIPFIISIIINRLNLVGEVYNKSSAFNISNTILNIWLYISIIYWYWVGKKFGDLGKGRRKSFILGNGLWIIGFVFHIILFYFVKEGNRVKLMKVTPVLSQLTKGYSLGFIKLSNFVVSPFSKVSNNMKVLVSYILMLIIFSVGFYRGKHRKFI